MELEKLNLTEANISRVNHSKMDSIRKEVKILAIKAAKEKADYLLAAIGEQTGKPLVIKENEILPNLNLMRGNNTRPKDSFNNSDGYSFKSSDKEEIHFQKITIQTSIYVKFSIK